MPVAGTRRKIRSGGLGRPRSAAADAAILAATRELLGEVGYARLTIEGVAARAGVAKSTLYRRWATRADLVVDAALEPVAELLANRDADLTAEDAVRRLVEALRRPESQAAYLAVLAEAARDDTLHARVQVRLIEPARELVAAIGRREGHGTDPDLLVDVVAGAVLHRILVSRGAADERFVRDLVALARAVTDPSGVSASESGVHE